MNEQQIRQLIAVSIDRAIDLAPIPRVRPGTVTATGSDSVLVRIDGDDASVLVQNLTGQVFFANDRVMILLQPPRGAFVVGSFGRDDSQLTTVESTPGGGAVGPFTTTETTVHTATFSTLPYATTNVVLVTYYAGLTVVTDTVEARLKVNGALQKKAIRTGGATVNIGPAPVDIAAGGALVVDVTMLRAAGTGTVQTFVDGSTNGVTVIRSPTSPLT